VAGGRVNNQLSRARIENGDLWFVFLQEYRFLVARDLGQPDDMPRLVPAARPANLNDTPNRITDLDVGSRRDDHLRHGAPPHPTKHSRIEARARRPP
jgi:hypothetical protein